MNRGRLDVEARVNQDPRSPDIIDDADGEAGARVLFPEVVEDGLCHRGREIF